MMRPFVGNAKTAKLMSGRDLDPTNIAYVCATPTSASENCGRRIIIEAFCSCAAYEASKMKL
jgi:hypothetical protein